MNAGVIVDASVSLAWLFEPETWSQRQRRILEEVPLVAPSLWKIEVVNAVLVKERRKELSEAQGSRFLAVLEALDIQVIALPPSLSLQELALRARPHQLTSYDAVYLDLAITTGLPLYTYDHNLQVAAERLGVERIVEP